MEEAINTTQDGLIKLTSKQVTVSTEEEEACTIIIGKDQGDNDEIFHANTSPEGKKDEVSEDKNLSANTKSEFNQVFQMLVETHVDKHFTLVYTKLFGSTR